MASTYIKLPLSGGVNFDDLSAVTPLQYDGAGQFSVLNASTSQSGVVTAATQSFLGFKTFDATQYTLGNTSSLATASQSIFAGSLSYGTGYSYSLVGKRTMTLADASSRSIFSVTASTLSPPTVNVNPGASGAANYSGTGYTADGTDFSFTVYTLFSSDTFSSPGAGYSVSQDSSFNPYSIDHSITPPTNPGGQTPSNYLIVRDVDQNYQIRSGSFSDDNTAWNAGPPPSYTPLTGYSNSLTWSAASSADDYRIRNTTQPKWTDKGSTTTSITDSGTWTLGTPTLTPVSPVYDYSIRAVGDMKLGSAESFLGFFGATPVQKQSGSITAALSAYGLVTSPYITSTGTAYRVGINDSTGALTTDEDLMYRNGGIGFGFGTKSLADSAINTDSLDIATQINFRVGASYTTGGTQSNVSTATSSHIYSNFSGTTTFTGFSGGYEGKVLFVTNGPTGTIAFANESASSTAANRIVTGFAATVTCLTSRTFMFVYDATNSRWRLVGGDGQGLLSASNSWTGVSNSFSTTTLVIVQGAFRFFFVEKTADYTLTTADGNIQYNSASNRTLTLYSANVTSQWHYIKNTNTGTVTINTTGGQTIDTYASGQIVLQQNDCILLTPAVIGTTWRIAGFWKNTSAGRITFGDANGVPATSSEFVFSTAAGLVGNESGGTAIDLRWEGDTDANLLFVDASADKVGVGNASPNSKLDVGGSFQCDTVTNDTGLAHGTYTPTLTNVANLDASTAYQCQYMRVGNTVSVSGKVDIDPTLAATSTQLGISLPVASNLGAAEDCAGVAFASGVAGQGAAILGDATNNRAQLQYVSGDVTNQAMYFSFQYEVI